ncbi:MAG: hypothetical protein AAF629_31715 [Chloroflexota bacterium]
MIPKIMPEKHVNTIRDLSRLQAYLPVDMKMSHQATGWRVTVLWSTLNSLKIHLALVVLLALAVGLSVFGLQYRSLFWVGNLAILLVAGDMYRAAYRLHTQNSSQSVQNGLALFIIYLGVASPILFIPYEAADLTRILFAFWLSLSLSFLPLLLDGLFSYKVILHSDAITFRRGPVFATQQRVSLAQLGRVSITRQARLFLLVDRFKLQLGPNLGAGTLVMLNLNREQALYLSYIIQAWHAPRVVVADNRQPEETWIQVNDTVVNIHAAHGSDMDQFTQQLQQEPWTKMVNPLSHYTAIDFRSIDDHAAEKLILRVQSDENKMRQMLYRLMLCRVSTTCQFSTNTMRLLEKTFGHIEVYRTKV